MAQNKLRPALIDCLTRGIFRPLLTTAVLYLAIGFLLRIILWTLFGRNFDVSFIQLIGSLGLGALNDLIVLPPLLLPFTLALLFLPERAQNSRLLLALGNIGGVALIFGVIYLAMVQCLFFAEFNGRFNLVAVDYLIYPHEVFINIWETYHVVYLLLAAAFTALLIFLSLRKKLVRTRSHPCSFSKRLTLAGCHILLASLVLVFFSTDSLALFDNRVANEITANGISSLFRACHTNQLDYNQYYRTMESGKAFRIIRQELSKRGGLLSSNAPDSIDRTFKEIPGGLGKMNVVVLVEESFGAQFNGSYGDTRHLTPNFDRYAKQGILFGNAFATGTRTVRGLAAIVSSLPPIPSEGIIKRPGSENLANWGRVMRGHGYQTSFLYGGYGLFDNMNHFFAGNGFSISDRRNIDKVTFANIWGVCDQDLLDHALDYFDQAAASKKPFFSVIMSTSNHQPYTFPENIPGIPARGGGRLAGIKYADYTIGRFLDQAAAHSWYDNTAFVVVADHDARVYGSQQVPLKHYRIPLLVLAPKRIHPARVDIATSQIDIAPTVMGLLGLPYKAPFYGQDVLHARPGQPRPILVNHDHDVGLLMGDKLTVLGLHKSSATYRYNQQTESLAKVTDDLPLTDLATAYFQTAFELFKSGRYQ